MTSKRDYTFVRKGDKLPRNRQGDKPGYFPERHLVDPETLKVGKPHMKGSSRVVSGGYVQSAYAIPITGRDGRKADKPAPIHISKETGKVYVGGHHRWHTGSKPKPRPTNRLFDKASSMPKDDWTATGPGKHQWSKAERAFGLKRLDTDKDTE